MHLFPSEHKLSLLQMTNVFTIYLCHTTPDKMRLLLLNNAVSCFQGGER